VTNGWSLLSVRFPGMHCRCLRIPIRRVSGVGIGRQRKGNRPALGGETGTRRHPEARRPARVGRGACAVGVRRYLIPTSRDLWTIVETPLAHARSYQKSKTQMTLVLDPQRHALACHQSDLTSSDSCHAACVSAGGRKQTASRSLRRRVACRVDHCRGSPTPNPKAPLGLFGIATRGFGEKLIRSRRILHWQARPAPPNFLYESEL
jgi:hypothetical protein